MIDKNIFNWTVTIILLSGLLLLSSCAGLPVRGTVGGQTFETRVDSEVARYYLEAISPAITAMPRSMSVSIASTRAANGHLPDRNELKRLSDDFSVDFAALYFADQIARVPVNRRFRSAFDRAYEYTRKAFPEGQVSCPQTTRCWLSPRFSIRGFLPPAPIWPCRGRRYKKRDSPAISSKPMTTVP